MYYNKIVKCSATLTKLQFCNHEKQKIMRRSASKDPLAENEEDRTQQADACAQIVERRTLLQEEDGEGGKYAESDNLLQYLELPDRHDLMTDAVGGHLQQVLEEGDAPATQGRHNPVAVAHVLQVAIPGQGHEDIAATK